MDIMELLDTDSKDLIIKIGLDQGLIREEDLAELQELDLEALRAVTLNPIMQHAEAFGL